MRLASIDLPRHLSDALTALGITSDTDLLFSFGSPLEIWRRLPPGLISLHEFEICVQAVLTQTSATSVPSDVLHTQAQVKLGLPSLDAVLEGLLGPRVIELSGDTGSGKSVRLLVTDIISVGL